MTEAAKRSWILGASSGIGAALAEALAQRGERLILSGRNAEALAELASSLPGQGHSVLPLDVRDAPALAAAFQQIWSHEPRLKCVVFMAGIYEPMSLDGLDLVAVRAILEVNLLGAFNLIAALEPMLKGGSACQLAFCASVAGYRGLPNAQPYGASKAGLINLVESLRVEQGHRHDIRLISPGFVATRLTDKNRFAMPFVLTPEQAGARIAKGLARRRGFEHHFPRRFTLALKALAALPYGLYWPLARRAR
jgi:NAD(P)-dependent dehydrogenase (short-subunit alcohol dehydrogenase family)